VLRVSVLLVDSFHELSDDKWHALDSLDLFLRSDKFTFQTPATWHLSDCTLETVISTNLCSSLMYSSCKWMYLTEALVKSVYHSNPQATILEMSLVSFQC
jgi:hypothetical protein